MGEVGHNYDQQLDMDRYSYKTPQITENSLGYRQVGG